MISGRKRADAIRQEDMTAHWRDWCTYLRANISLLDVRSALKAGRTAFEQADSQEQREQQARDMLDAIPLARRNLFDAVREGRRLQYHGLEERTIQSEASRRAIDPDDVDRRALVALLAEAEGQETEDGWGLVPEGTLEALEWYKLDVSALLDAPDEALYALNRSSAADKRKQLRLLMAICGGALAVLVLWMLWPKTGSGPTSESSAIITAGNSDPLMWEPQTLVVHQADRPAITLPISKTVTSAWPPAANAAHPISYWRPSIAYPLTICLPAATLQAATQIDIAAGIVLPIRQYRLGDSNTPRAGADLLVQPCDGSEQMSRQGSFQALTEIPALMIGEAGTFGRTQVVMQSIQVVGPGNDPTLPAGQVRILVSALVTTPVAVDWPALAPSLLLSSGEMLLPSDVQTTDATHPILSYLAPAPVEAMLVAWQIAPPQQALITWRATIPAPPTRDGVLRSSLQVEDVQPTYLSGGELTLQVRVSNTSAVPLMLTPADIHLLRGDSAVVVPTIAELQAQIPAHDNRTFSLSVPADSSQRSVLLIIGTEQFRISPTP